MRFASVAFALFVVGLAPAADPAKPPSKADLEKQIKDAKAKMEKAAKELESFKKDKEIGAEVVKHLAARAKFLEARLKQFELQALPNYTAAVEKQDNAWAEVANKKSKEVGEALKAIEKLSAEKAKKYAEAFAPFDEAQVAVQDAQARLIHLKAGGK